MRTQKLKRQVKDYYRAQVLSDDKLKLLMDMNDEAIKQRDFSTNRANPHYIGAGEVDFPVLLSPPQLIKKLANREKITGLGRYFIKQRFAMVASLVFLLVSFWGVSNFEQNQVLTRNFSQLIAQEIALNHNKQLDLEFVENKYEKLANLMAKLDFTVLASNHKKLVNLEIIGARYCSIQGNIAAQIRMRSTISGKYYTLYQTKLSSLLKKKPGGSQRIGQVEVTQWQENNLFYGLAESIDPSS